jgi:aminocarboxymuconate-semialdehyde decarboxylase
LKQKYGYGGFVQLEHDKESGNANMTVDGKFFRAVERNVYDSDSRISDCTRDDIDVQVLSTVPIMFSYWAQPKDGLDLAKYLNDNLAQTVAENPKRFVGLGTLPMQAPELAVTELRRCMQDLGLKGAQIGTHIDMPDGKRVNLSDAVVQSALGGGRAPRRRHFRPSVGHDGQGAHGEVLAALARRHARRDLARHLLVHFRRRFRALSEAQGRVRALRRLVPGTVGRIEHGHKCRPDLCAIDNAKNPRDYCGHFWVDSLIHDAKMFEYVVDLLGADKIILGTDYPFPLGDVHPFSKPGHVIDESKYSDEIKRKMFGLNACEFLGLDPNDYA